MSSERESSSGGGCGCASVILSILVVWALFFGVTWGGVHHEVSCSRARGVEVSP